MAQTTSAITSVAGYVALSPDGSSWTDISGMANKVEFDAQTRTTGEIYTFDGDTALLGWGKREPFEVTVSIVYTEGASDAYTAAYTSLTTAGGGRCQLQWVPAGNTTTKYTYTTGTDSKVSEMPPAPAGEAESGDPLVLEFKIKSSSFTKGAVA